MAANTPSSEEDLTCPVCCDIFTDPVVLLCGHSFCKDCLQEWWRQSRLHTCPVCKEIFTMPQPPRNLALRNVSDTKRQERIQRANAESAEFCRQHSERLKLFCETDQELICVICRDSQKHKKHNCAPVNEAVQAQRTQLQVKVMTLKTKLGSFKKERLKCDNIRSHIELQAQRTEKTVKEEFQKLYQFLRAEEVARIDAVRTEASAKSEAINIRIVNLTAEISTLTHKIKTVEKDMRTDDLSFMRNIKSTNQQSRCNLPLPKPQLGALIDEAKHIGNLQFTVWNKMRRIIKYTPVILNPNSASAELIISKHMTCSTKTDKRLPLPENPERLSCRHVLGSEGFSSGKHSWGVEVGGYWHLGVALSTNHSIYRKRWGIYKCVCTDVLREVTPQSDSKEVPKDPLPKKVRVHLDYDQGILTFFDLEQKTLVHTIKHKFKGTVFPFFCDDAKILPASVLVTTKDPR